MLTIMRADKMCLLTAGSIILAWVVGSFAAFYSGSKDLAETWAFLHLPVFYLYGAMDLFTNHEWLFVLMVSLTYAIPIGLFAGFIMYLSLSIAARLRKIAGD